MKNLNNKVAVITGGGSGIGQALAIALAQEGCHLALADINQQGLDESKEKLSSFNVKVSTHIVDVSQIEQLEQLAKEVIEQHNGVNILINNAGIVLQKDFASHDVNDWQRMIGINLFGVIYGCHIFLPHLLKAKDANIVNLSSLAGFAGLPTQAPYCVTKAGVKALSETLYSELASEGVCVTSVHPGAIRTNLIHASLADADDIKVATRNAELIDKVSMPVDKAAKIIVKAIKKNRQRVLIGMDAKLVELLKRLFPSLLHKLAAYAYKKIKKS